MVLSAACTFGLSSMEEICELNWVRLVELCTMLLICPSNLKNVAAAAFTLLGALLSAASRPLTAPDSELKEASRAFWTAGQFPDAMALASAPPSVLANDDPSFL